VLLAVVGLANASSDVLNATVCGPVDGTITQFKFKNITEDGEIDLSKIAKDKVVLIVNVATY